MASIPDTAEPIPETGGDYLATPDGEIWSTKWRAPRRMSQRAGRVCLWIDGRRYEPLAQTLIDRTFGGIEQLVDNNELIDGLMDDHGLSRKEAEAIVSAG